MKKSICAEALMFAELGQRVAILDETHELGESFRAVEDALSSEVVSRVSRVNGRQQVSMKNGGQLSFHAISAGLRSLSFDKVYLPAELVTPGLMRELAPLVSTSREPAIIGCL